MAQRGYEPKIVEHPASAQAANPEQSRDMMRKVLKLDEPLAEQRKVWRFYVDQSGDNVGNWRNLARQAKAAIRYGGEGQAWRYTALAAAAPNEEIINGIFNMATQDGVYSPDLEKAIEDRIEELAEEEIVSDLIDI